MGFGSHACIRHWTVFIVTLREYLGSIDTIFRFGTVCEDPATNAYDEVSCCLILVICVNARPQGSAVWEVTMAVARQQVDEIETTFGEESLFTM